MAGLPRVTGREEMSALANGEENLTSQQRRIDYQITLPDLAQSSQLDYATWINEGPPDQIDGITNDDSYRRSRHLLLNPNIAPSLEDGMREISLARQLQDKGERPATIRLVRRRTPEEISQSRKSGEDKVLPWENLIPPNTKFFLEAVQENREEKVQVIDTFGEWIAFFFGRKPEVYSYSGTLLNAKNHDWKNEFQENYEHFLRGTKAVQYRATMLLQYDDVLVEGYMINSSIQMSGMADKAVPFTFNLLVINRSPMNPRGMIARRLDRSGESKYDKMLLDNMNDALDLTQNGRIDELETFLLMREYFAGNYIAGAGTSEHYLVSNRINPHESQPPGKVGGLNNPPVESLPFDSTNTKSLETSGVTTPSIAIM